MSLVLLEYPAPSVVLVKINRPEKMNALSAALIEELTQTFVSLQDKARSYETRAVVVTSVDPRAFCAGADLSERSKMNEEQVSGALKNLRALMDSVAALSCATLAAVDGMAFGGGLELALCCDLRISSPQSKMGLTEVKLGIIPGAGGTQRLRRILGEAKAKELIFLAKVLTGEEAASAGVVHECVSDPVARAMELAEQISQMGPIAISSAKRAVEGGANMPMKEALDWERRCYENTLRSQDRLEGLSAFLEKRKAEYKGR